MASDKSPQDKPSVADEKNPFVTFTRLVDQQVSSLVQNILDFPNSFTTLRANAHNSYRSPASTDEQRRWRDEAEEFEKSINEFFGQHQQDGQDEDQAQRPHEQSLGALLARQSLQEHPDDRRYGTGNERDEAHRILDLVPAAFSQVNSDDESEAFPIRCPYDPQSRCPYRPESSKGREDPSTARAWNTLPFWRSAPAPWLADYLDESPYSPLQLEDRQGFCEHGAKWRRAFADLLAVQHGLDAPPEHQREDMTRENRPFASPFYLATRQDFLGGNATREPENDSEEDGPTELDLYKHFLGAGSRHPTSSTSNPPFSSSASPHDALGQPNVISVMTTTQRTTRPDGSVFTQVLLKKSFSDGREESTETEHTSHGAKGNTKSMTQFPRPRDEHAAKPSPALGYDGQVKQKIEQRLEEKKKKNGWFWS
ncbi:MAG: hypothetical protein Q9169_003054 [Polycauliona sp. 2 TL-2023]